MDNQPKKIDKSKWGDGPWQYEPDRLEWKDAATGLPCLMVRGPVGSWCGYAGVEPSHAWHGAYYADVETPTGYLQVHGGLTYSGACSGQICHVPAPGESDDIWWFGFDTAHSGDFPPGMKEFPSLFEKKNYKTVFYVQEQVTQLAAQLAANKGTPLAKD